MKDEGVAGMVRSAAWLEHVCGLEVLSIGRPPNGIEDCGLELAGGALFVRVGLRSGQVSVHACGMDELELQLIFSIGDGPEGWTVVRRFIQALERSGIKSLRERPVRIGESGSPDSWVIG